MSVSSGFSSIWQEQRKRTSVDLWAGCMLILMLIGAAIWLRALMPMNSDTSWLISASEMLLDGKKLYVDIGETNPPASIWLYAPVVAFARLLGIRPEPVVNGYIFAMLTISLALTGVILARSGWLKRFNGFLLTAIFLVLFAILPGASFSEREHVAAMLCLPFLAATLIRAGGAAPSWPLLIAAGICGGIVVIIKPHFLLALELPVLMALWVQPRLRTLFSPENVIAGFLCLAYIASTFIFYREFWTMAMPVNATVYLPNADRLQAFRTITTPILVALCLTSWLFCGRSFPRHPAGIVLAASVGFYVAFVVQGKLWPYHVYPAVALGVLGGALAAFDRRLLETGGRQTEVSPLLARVPFLCRLANPGVVAVGALVGFSSLFFIHGNYQVLAAIITRLHPNPVIASLSGDISVGYPVTRMVNGRWGATQPSLWVIANGIVLRRRYPDLSPSKLSAVEAVENADLAVLLADLRRNRPDILLALKQETSLLERLRAFPGMKEELDRYEFAGRAGLVEEGDIVDILRRRPDLRSSMDP
ncbi:MULTISPECIES: hypothetical protein [unclassified Beijerinckia]|uniref:hypothetical protein n=1 Tax=unclassified Beijerinckia TaxID=2638183 RepID=UPI0008968A4C|nr:MULTISPECIES: hypothetical protein [unclassified Beijerinckia]MDH7799664.1 hypothetical protein [Beijerinckia sp. GAS462]SEB48942.1 hypothetical protein SAMN05443249_0156 [Beijerinckia sp. 28-YEA-48]